MRPAIVFIKETLAGQKLTGAEIGVSKGNNAWNMLISLDIYKLYLIDTWEPYEQYGKTLDTSGYFDKVKDNFKNLPVSIIKGASNVTVKTFEDDSLDFVYIDGCHQYESIIEDITVWFNKVRNGGIVSGHDYRPEHPGVVQAVYEFTKKHDLEYSARFDDWWILKRRRN